MPRIPYSLLLQGHKISPLLPLILRPTRDLQSAKNELRWLVEHVQETIRAKSPRDFPYQKRLLLKLCRRRERGEPIQYILGSQPFGELDIKCRHGVLIPRPETEAYTTHLANMLLEEKVPGIEYEKYLFDRSNSTLIAGTKRLRLLDICCGSGCISLLLGSMLAPKLKLIAVGIDISLEAVKLARENGRALQKFLRGLRTCYFKMADIFQKQPVTRPWDIVVANPPYISLDDFNKTTTRSVRSWEPKLALVPPAVPDEEKVDPDIFYRRIIQLNKDMFKSKILLMEVGDNSQAKRVVEIAEDIIGSQCRIELWRDAPEGDRVSFGRWRRTKTESSANGNHTLIVSSRGSGNFRAVAIYAPASPILRSQALTPAPPKDKVDDSESSNTGGMIKQDPKKPFRSRKK